MGDLANLRLEGYTCERCGCIVESLIQPGTNVLKEAPGHPQLCIQCTQENDIGGIEVG